MVPLSIRDSNLPCDPAVELGQEVDILIKIHIDCPRVSDSKDQLREEVIVKTSPLVRVEHPLLVDLLVHFLLPVVGEEGNVDKSHESLILLVFDVSSPVVEEKAPELRGPLVESRVPSKLGLFLSNQSVKEVDF